MYGVEGRTCGDGDPIAANERERRELAWQFRELCERHGGWPVFYQIYPDNLGLYVELGLTLLKFGEEARVPLATFSLTASRARPCATASTGWNGTAIDSNWWIPPPKAGVAAPTAGGFDAWLGGKGSGEKGFRSDSSTRIICGPARSRWCDTIPRWWPSPICGGGGGEELSVDLMRYRPDSVQGVMDYLFIRIMLGREPGSLGSISAWRRCPACKTAAWRRCGTGLAPGFRSRRGVLQFSGLHQYKDKFDPDGSALSGGTGRHDGVTESAGGPTALDCPRPQRSHRTITTTTQDQSCVPLSRMLSLIVVLLTSAVRADVVEETLDNPIFGKLAVYHVADEPKGVVLLASGVGGWNAELATVAREIANLDYTVAGIDSNEYLARLDRSTAARADPSTDFEQLNCLDGTALSAGDPPTADPAGTGYRRDAGLRGASPGASRALSCRDRGGFLARNCSLRKAFVSGRGNLEGTASPDHKNVSLKP